MKKGRLLILALEIGEYPTRAICKCDCGRYFITDRRHVSLTGFTKSCGCLRKEQSRKLGLANKTHGEIDTPLYQAWRAMKYRCLNSHAHNYKYYGGRGIKVCNRWLNSYENFSRDIGKRPTIKHSLDRINTNGNYEPENCRWATRSQQQRNRRKSNVK